MEQPNPTPFRVLLVEDSEDDCFLLLREMRKGGFQPAHERIDTLDAVEAALARQFDLVICDYNLPGFDAFSVLALARRLRPELPVIIVSGAIGEELAVEALHAGARDYIMKDNLTRLNPAIRRELKELELYRQQQDSEAARQEIEEHFRQLAGNLEAVFWLVDCDREQMIYVSAAFEQVWEVSPERLFVDLDAILDSIHPEDYSRVQQLLATEGWPNFNAEYRIVRPDGSVRWITTHTFAIHNAEGRAYRCAGLSHDITERKQLEFERKKLSRALEQTADAVMITDCEGLIEYINPAFESMTGYAREEVLGKRPSILGSGFHDREFFSQMWKTLLAGMPFHEIFINRRKDGDLYYEAKTITPVRDERGDVTHFVSTGKDITESLRKRQAERRVALYDEVTGLPSRVLFQDRLGQAIQQSRRSQAELAVLAVGFDLAGIIGDDKDPLRDQLFTAISERLCDAVRGIGSVARLDLEELALMLRSVKSRAEVEDAALRIAGAFEQPIHAAGYELFLTPRIGISLCPEHSEAADALIDKARAAMQASREGNAPFRYYSRDLRPAGPAVRRRSN